MPDNKEKALGHQIQGLKKATDTKTRSAEKFCIQQKPKHKKQSEDILRPFDGSFPTNTGVALLLIPFYNPVLGQNFEVYKSLSPLITFHVRFKKLKSATYGCVDQNIEHRYRIWNLT